MKILKIIIVIISGLIFSGLTFRFFGSLYTNLFETTGSWLDFSDLYGLPAAYLYAVFLIASFLIKNAGGWTYILISLPAIAFQLYFDPIHIYFPVFFALAGWGTSTLIRKLFLHDRIS